MLETIVILVILYFIWALIIHPLIAMKVESTKQAYRAHAKRLELAQKRGRNDGSEWLNDRDL